MQRLSYYCFEFVWISRGLSLTRRVRHIEERWGYYLAFGTETPNRAGRYLREHSQDCFRLDYARGEAA